MNPLDKITEMVDKAITEIDKLRATNAALTAENAQLRARLKEHGSVEVPSTPPIPAVQRHAERCPLFPLHNMLSIGDAKCSCDRRKVLFAAMETRMQRLTGHL